MEDTTIDKIKDTTGQKKKKYSTCLNVLTLIFGIFLVVSPWIFKYYSCILNDDDFPFYLRTILLFISLCWISALFVCVLSRILFMGGFSNSDLHVVRILGQSTMILVLTGIVLILLVCIKVLFLL